MACFQHLSHFTRRSDGPSRYDYDLRTEVTWPSDLGVTILREHGGQAEQRRKDHIPNWAKYVLRILGMVNAIIALIGMILEIQSAHFFYADTNPSFSRIVFAAMALVNLAFVTVLFVTAIRFIQAKVSVIDLYSVAVLILFVYRIVIRALWHSGGRVAVNVAGLTGLGNMGIAPFAFLLVVPYLYPFLSVGLVQALKHHYGTAQIPVST